MRKLMIRLWPGCRLSLLLGLGPLVCPPLQVGMLGDHAPEFQIKEWKQGGPINLKVGAGKEIDKWMT